MEIKIAICDDEVNICMHIEKILTDILPEKFSGYHIDACYSGEELCKNMQEKKYDLIFLDIELPKMSGVEIGKYIREAKKDNMIKIVYISSKQEYAMELFKIRPMDFLVKPLTRKQIEDILEIYINLTRGMEDYFHYKIRTSKYKIQMKEIMYFVRDHRQIYMVTTGGKIIFYESLETVYRHVKEYGFLFIHKSYIVNYRFIEEISYDHVVMTDNETLSISQSKRKQVRDQYIKLEG